MDAFVRFTQCSLLQCVQRCVPALGVLQRSAAIVHETRQLAVLIAKFTDLLTKLSQVPLDFIPGLTLALLLGADFIQLLMKLLATDIRARLIELAPTVRKPLNSRLDLLCASGFNMVLVPRVIKPVVVLIPLLLPVGQGLFGLPK